MVRRILTAVRGDSHYRNSLFLILSNVATAGLGFAFWLVATRLYDPADVGVAGALISAVTLLTTLSVLGLNVSIIRYLATSKLPNSVISTALAVTSAAALVLGVGFVAGVKWFSPELAFLQESALLAGMFVLYTILANSTEITKNAFIAYRSSKYVLTTNLFLALAKLGLLFGFVGGAAFGLFSAWMVALALAAVLCVSVLVRQFAYRVEFNLPQEQTRKMVRFSFANYLSGFFEMAPLSLIPIMAASMIGPAQTAALYLGFTMANVLFNLAIAISSSFFAEGSANEGTIRRQALKTVRIMSVTVLPAALIMFVASKYILLLFGKNYSADGAALLSILAVSALFFAANVVLAIVLRLEHRMKLVVGINALGAIVIVGAALVPAFQSLTGLGYAWLAGQMVMSVAYMWSTRRTVFSQSADIAART